MSWQEELERILSPGTAQSDREVLLKDLLGRGPEIAQQVTEAVSSGSFASVLPDNGQSSELMDDLAMVQRQVLHPRRHPRLHATASPPPARAERHCSRGIVPLSALSVTRRQVVEDILPALEPALLQEAVQRAAMEGPGLAQEAASTAPAAVASLLQDPARALNLMQQEARNVVSRTPEGLETPPYRLVGSGNGYETREYGSVGVAVTPIAVAWDLAAITVGFNQVRAVDRAAPIPVAAPLTAPSSQATLRARASCRASPPPPLPPHRTPHDPPHRPPHCRTAPFPCPPHRNSLRAAAALAGGIHSGLEPAL